MVPYFVVVLAGRQARLRPPPRLAQFLLGPFFNLSMGVQYKSSVSIRHFLRCPSIAGVRNGLRTPVLLLKSVINTRTKNPQIFVQEAQKSEDSSFANPGNLCETLTPGNAEKTDHRTDYLAEMLTWSRRRQYRQRACCSAVSGLHFSPFSAALTSASFRSACLCLVVTLFDHL